MPVIVSLTSYGPRIANAHYAVHSLLSQTVKPDHVILWLTYGEPITQQLADLCKRGLEIKYCDDLKSFKKIIPALQTFPNSIIVTADDDLIYKPKWLKKLYLSYLKESGAIWCHRSYSLDLKEHDSLSPFRQRTKNRRATDAHGLIFLCSGAGILFPPDSLPTEVLNISMFKKLCFSCDDTWLTSMALLNNMECKVVPKPYYDIITVTKSQTSSLWRTNSSKQDEIIKAVFTHYNLYELVK